MGSFIFWGGGGLDVRWPGLCGQVGGKGNLVSTALVLEPLSRAFWQWTGVANPKHQKDNSSL